METKLRTKINLKEKGIPGDRATTGGLIKPKAHLRAKTTRMKVYKVQNGNK